jgi:hypothetical protein
MIIPRYLFLQPEVQVSLIGIDDLPGIEQHQAQEPILHRLQQSHTFLRGLLELLSESMIGQGEMSKYVPQSFDNTSSIQEICNWYYVGSPEAKNDGLVQLRFAAMLHEWRMYQQRNLNYTGSYSVRDATWTPIICSVLEHAFAALSLRRQAGGAELSEAPMAELTFLTRT